MGSPDIRPPVAAGAYVAQDQAMFNASATARVSAGAALTALWRVLRQDFRHRRLLIGWLQRAVVGQKLVEHVLDGGLGVILCCGETLKSCGCGRRDGR